jgi:hypothetical protein
LGKTFLKGGRTIPTVTEVFYAKVAPLPFPLVVFYYLLMLPVTIYFIFTNKTPDPLGMYRFEKEGGTHRY